MKRGRYIAWEGPDGIGKGTQMKIALAESERRGIPTLSVHEPGSSEIGPAIRRILLDPDGPDLHPKTETALFLAERAQLWHGTIQPALEGGYDVHSDRTWWSTIAYQGMGGALSPDFIVATHELFLEKEYLRPDIGFVFHMSEEERKMRKSLASTAEFGSLDRMEQKGDPYFLQVERGYQYARDKLGAIGINASGTIEEVTARWWSYVFPEAA